MSEGRPLALKIYCALFAVFVALGAAYAVLTLMAPAAIAPTLVDIALALFPLGIVAIALVGLWFMRWWAVALFWLCVFGMTMTMLLAPLPAPGVSIVALALNAAIWVGLIAAPPTIIAVAYHRRFR